MATTMQKVMKSASKAAKAVKNKVAPKKPSKMKKAAAVVGIAAAVVGAGLAARSMAGRKKTAKRKKK